MGEFADRVALVTGADGGLGAAVTAAFLEAGARVAGVSRAGPGLPPGAGERFLSVRADLAVAGQAERAAAAVLDRFQRLDVVAHLVGGFEGGSPVAGTSDDTWRRMLDVNLTSAFYVARATVPILERAGRGRFLAIGSRTALEPAPGLAAYGVSKAGLVMLVRTLALELKRTAVTANAVLPSVIDTPSNRAAMPAADSSAWVQPASIAALLLWLASDAAAGVNGAAIPIYGRA
jgi:NAD(P)-dependent dehydrogenase (short-subunit alcohol dehydrogenase family)